MLKKLALFCLLTLAVLSAHAREAAPEVGVKVSPNLGGESQLAEAGQIQSRGERLAKRIQVLLDAARREGDIIKVTGLNDKLTQANANLRNVTRRIASLREALAMNNSERANHEFTVLTVLSQKFAVLDQEASQLVGQAVFEPGAAEVVTEIEDPSQTISVSVPPVVVITPPPRGGGSGTSVNTASTARPPGG